MENELNLQTSIDFSATTETSSIKSKSLEEKRELLLDKIFKGHTDTLLQRVAYILNLYPETRDSDIKLQIQYWELFEPELFDGVIDISTYFQLTKLTSITRARATIQNDYKLFLASIPVRQSRGKLSEDEKQLAKDRKEHFPGIYVFADESGKNDNNLIVGSVWFFDGPSLGSFLLKIQKWRTAEEFKQEFHFKDIDKVNLDKYLRFADILISFSPACSYKTISLAREGIKNVQDTFKDLYYYLLLNGIRFEIDTNRISLPKALEIWKDKEEIGYDHLLINELKEKFKLVSQTEFDSNLSIGSIETEDSSRSYALQIADLFTGCVNRYINQGLADKPKDIFAKHFLSGLKAFDRINNKMTINDRIFHLAL